MGGHPQPAADYSLHDPHVRRLEIGNRMETPLSSRGFCHFLPIRPFETIVEEPGLELRTFLRSARSSPTGQLLEMPAKTSLSWVDPLSSLSRLGLILMIPFKRPFDPRCRHVTMSPASTSLGSRYGIPAASCKTSPGGRRAVA